jgi:hypothetical protein
VGNWAWLWLGAAALRGVGWCASQPGARSTADSATQPRQPSRPLPSPSHALPKPVPLPLPPPSPPPDDLVDLEVSTAEPWVPVRLGERSQESRGCGRGRMSAGDLGMGPGALRPSWGVAGRAGELADWVANPSLPKPPTPGPTPYPIPPQPTPPPRPTHPTWNEGRGRAALEARGREVGAANGGDRAVMSSRHEFQAAAAAPAPGSPRLLPALPSTEGLTVPASGCPPEPLVQTDL